jgi:hypothetical protein
MTAPAMLHIYTISVTAAESGDWLDVDGGSVPVLDPRPCAMVPLPMLPAGRVWQTFLGVAGWAALTSIAGTTPRQADVASTGGGHASSVLRLRTRFACSKTPRRARYSCSKRRVMARASVTTPRRTSWRAGELWSRRAPAAMRQRLTRTVRPMPAPVRRVRRRGEVRQNCLVKLLQATGSDDSLTLDGARQVMTPLEHGDAKRISAHACDRLLERFARPESDLSRSITGSTTGSAGSSPIATMC